MAKKNRLVPTPTFFVALVAAACLMLPSLAAARPADDLAAVDVSASSATFQPRIEYREVRVTVSGPRGFQVVKSFGARETPTVELPGTNGLYKYELRFSPLIERTAGDRSEDQFASGADAATDKLTVQRGSFTLAADGLVPDDLVEGTADSLDDAALIPAPTNLVLSNSDGVIRNSLCVGFDCPNSPAFGDSTILMMENNTRIKFGDTSNSPFPNNDWEIEANSASSGGASYLGFNDCGSADNDGGCTTDLVFAVESGARQSALYVESDGDVGIGTSNPVLDLHIVTGNSPSIRLDQDGSSGFNPQVWDIAGNEANFFIRDVTGGSRLPIRSRPGAPTSSIDIAADGDVGIGTSSPAEELHVRRTDAGPTRILVENTGANQTGMQFVNSVEDWRFTNDGAGRFVVNAAGGAGNEFLLESNGDITITGEITTTGSCSIGCDAVFEPEYEIESIGEHASMMWSNRHLPAVGPTPEDGQFNLTRKTAAILNELEKAHIYIEQLDARVKQLEAALAQSTDHQ